MRYYPIGLNVQDERGYVLWQTCHFGNFIVCLKQTKSLFERPYEMDDSNILVLKTSAEANQSNTKQMIEPATETKSKKVKSKKRKNV
jgi:hypothetical protein